MAPKCTSAADFDNHSHSAEQKKFPMTFGISTPRKGILTAGYIALPLR